MPRLTHHLYAAMIFVGCGQVGFERPSGATDAATDVTSADASDVTPTDVAPADTAGDIGDVNPTLPTIDVDSPLQVIGAARDADGNRTIVGHFDGELRAGGEVHGAIGLMRSAYVLSLAPAGDFRWLQSWRASNLTVLTGVIARGRSAEVISYMSGEVSEPFVFGPAGRQRGALIGFDTSDGAIPTPPTSYASPNGNVQLKAIATDGALSVIAGHYIGDLDFGLGSIGVTPSTDDYGAIALFEADGTPRWATAVAGARVQLQAAAVGGDLVAAAGFYQVGTVDTVHVAQGVDGIVVVHRSDGAPRFIASISSPAEETVHDVAVSLDTVAFVGSTTGAAALRTATNTDALPSSELGGRHGLVVVLDTSGALRWAQRIESAMGAAARQVRLLDDGRVLVHGQFDGVLEFGGDSWLSAGGSDVFLAEFSASGALLNMHVFGGAGDERTGAMLVGERLELIFAVDTAFEGPSGTVEGPVGLISLPL